MAETKAIDEMTYEEAFEELETIVHSLEDDDLELEEALARFERGQRLAARCSELLESAELKLRQLVPDEAGELETSDVPPEES